MTSTIGYGPHGRVSFESETTSTSASTCDTAAPMGIRLRNGLFFDDVDGGASATASSGIRLVEV
jgi:hypothetical protein